MANAKFTREMLEVALKNIIQEANDGLNWLGEHDTFDALSGVDDVHHKIRREIENIDFRLRDCDEY